MIEAQQLSVRRGRHWVLENVDFRAEAGQVTIVAGPNGSGKTTLLNALSEDVPYRGKVLMNGKDVASLKPWQKAQIRGVLPQQSVLSFPFQVGEIMALGLAAGHAGVANPDKTLADIGQAALQRVGLAGFGRRLYQELSGGEQARVQLARVLCQIWHSVYEGQPCWLLLDEPVASLDIEHQLMVMDMARRFACAGGGVVAILHDLNLAAGYADKLMLMKGGRITCAGSPAQVMTGENLYRIYNCCLEVNRVPDDNKPFVLPQTVKPWA